MKSFSLHGTEIELVRKKIKNIHLRVYAPIGRVIVSAPITIALETIRAFVLSKFGWIKKKQEKCRARVVQPEAIITASEKQQLSESISYLLPQWEIKMGVSVSRWSIRKMKTRWGSCSPASKSIRFSLALAKKSKVCLEYVIVHELVHLLEPSHNSRFKSLMDNYMPEWRVYRHELANT
jgi:predicted metal-dependent hydrolase